MILYAVLLVLAFIAGGAFYALMAWAILRWSMRL